MIKDPERVRYAWKWRRDHFIDLGRLVDMHDGLRQSLPQFFPLVSPSHRVMVSSGER